VCASLTFARTRTHTLAPHTHRGTQANLLCIYLGHRDIRATPLPPGHLPRLRRELVTLCGAMTQVLEAPTVSHSRHVLTAAGRRKHVAVSVSKRALHARITASFSALSAASRDTLAACAPGADASRLAQYQRDMIQSWEQLRCLKSYRTPQTTRAFAHVAVWAHPLIMGPYYAWVSAGTGVGFAVFLAVATAVALSALLNARIALEDPFVPGLLDTIRVAKELGLVQQNLAAFAAADGNGDEDDGNEADGGDGSKEAPQQQHSGANGGGDEHHCVAVAEGCGSGV
jgi:hypothetical protein